MRTTIKIFIALVFTSCSLFSQKPDTLLYYTKEYGDSLKSENTLLKDTISDLKFALDETINVVLDMHLNVDSAYWENTFADFTFRAKSESGKAEAEIILTDSTFMRVLYVGDSMNCMVKNKEGWIKGQLNFNFDK